MTAPVLPLMALLALLLTLAAPPASAQTNNEDDVGILAGLLQSYLSDAGREVTIRGFQGALSSRATIQSLSIADDTGVWLILRDVVLDWSRAALFNRRLEINELSAGEIHLIRLPGSEDDSALPSPTARADFRLPELPVSVNIGELRADAVVIEPAVTGQRAVLTLEGSMQLAGGEGTARFEARRTDGQEGQFRFSGAFDNETELMSLDLLLSEGREGIAASLLNIPDRPALSLAVSGAGPISDFEADIGLDTDGEERVAGTVRLTGASPQDDLPDGLHFIADIAGDLRPLMSTEMHPFFGSESRLRAQGARTEDGAISLYELTFNTRTMRLVGRADFGADGLPHLVDLIADVAREDGAPVVLPGSGDVTLHEAALNIEYDASVSRDWLVLAGIDRLNTPEMSVSRLDLEARGRLAPPNNANGEQGPMFDGVFDFSALGIDAADPALQQAIGDSVTGFMSVVWPGFDSPAEIAGLAVQGDTVSLSAQGILEGTTFDGFIEAEAPDLSAFSALAGRSLGGHALFTSTGQANLLTGALALELGLITTDLTVDQREFDNLLAGEATIRANVVRDQQGSILRDFGLNAGVLELRAAGQHLPEDIHVYTSVDISSLAGLGPGYGGAMSLDARLQSDGERQMVRLDATARDLALGDLPGAQVVRALLRGQTEISAEAMIEDDRITLREASVDGPQIGLLADGLWSDAQTDMQVTLSRLDISEVLAGASGRLAGQARVTGDAQARRLALDLASDGPLRTGMAEVDALIGQRLELGLAVILGADDSVEVETARLTTQALTVTAEGQQDANGAAEFALTGGVDTLARAVPGIDGAARVEASLSRAAGADNYDTSFSLSGPSDLSLSGGGSIREDFSNVAIRVDGQVNAAIANPIIQPFTVQGPLRINARIDGPPAISSVRGQAVMSNGRFVAPTQNIAVQNVEARAELMGQWAQIDVSGEAQTGGRVSVTGGLGLDGRRDLDLSVRADQLRIVRPRLFEAVVSGDVRLSGALATGPRVSGTVQVSEAEIRIPNSPLGRTGFVPDGLRHVGESAAIRRTREHAGILTGNGNGRDRVPVFLDLELQAPGRVFVRGRGLDAEMGGALRLGGSTRDIIPSGSFSLIRGRLDLLGNRFNLTEGSASMTGSFMPYVRLVASTDSDGVVTNIILEGEALEPEIRFTSVPELPQDEVLARLIFRRSLASLSPFQAAQLAMSVATLTGHAEGSFMTRTREALGLDDLDITTEADGSTAVRAGRYLTENVYTDLSVDSAGRGEVSINLDLTPSVTLRGRTDTEGRTGVGVFFERDY
ncbi:MAG: translocation/assembly module TamB domain-containing protein [Pararhodobacter sp.]|nr:translocation/assembly module TamB domain-containing protein [Pararhodobacter sp.]